MVEANKFKIGEIVVDRIRPGQRLVVSKIIGRQYHCQIYDSPSRAHLVFFERDLREAVKV